MHVPVPLHTPEIGLVQEVPLATLAVGVHTTVTPEQVWTPVWHPLDVLHAVGVMLSTVPSQSSSTPLHVSGVGDAATALHAVPVPLHTIVPERRHAPTPALQAAPVARQNPPQFV